MTDSRSLQAGTPADPRPRLAVTAVGGPTAVLEIGGLRVVTDPTFDAPGEYRSPSGALLTKTAPAAISASAVGEVDLVLLSHDQHPDNLDHSGRAFLRTAPLVYTTPSGAARLGGTATGLAPWTSTTVRRPGAGDLTVTAVPARHGPEGCEPVTGEVTGFVLTAPDLPTVYVSGDNASLDLVERIAGRFAPVEVAVLFAGAARPGVLDGALLTLDSEQTATAARLLRARRVVPVHFNSWGHFTENAEALTGAFDRAGLTDRLVLLRPGESARI
ncbi:MBL fold metallo-hydrolase [Actinoallomurus rhizosphaericola]|uniref:MBL fold metallo-hydrolase n=1 Tax=Actinoallomurus rhizosphaericola TaxID=2952536 RepID=UPI002091E105|nr:MBL fold metallo-hydrolase [Actinoallomurus rhizosphaericola]MCO5992445.1 MBL fold metallo-hydrolase [Actinoallomurus rhizosphaericola]